MFIVGLTGGIGSGKSAVAKCFEKFGITVVDADQVARQVVAAGTPALKQIAQHFGQDVILDDGSLNRPRLRQIVFANPEQRLWLEQLTHPLIRREIDRLVETATGAYVVLESPLLLESGQNRRVNRVLVVDVSEDMQIARAANRDNNNLDQIRAIINAQMSRAQRMAMADDLIDNSGSLESLESQVEQLHQTYLTLATESRGGSFTPGHGIESIDND